MKGLRWFIRLTFTIWNYRLQSSWHDASFRRLSDKLFTILSRLDVDAWVCVDVDATFVWRLIESLIQNTNSSVREYCRFAPLQQNILAFRIATFVKSVQNKCVCTTKNTRVLIFGWLFRPINHFVWRTMYISPVPPSCTRTRHAQRILWSLLLHIYTSILYIHVCICTYVYICT